MELITVDNELMVVKQIPVISEKLREVKGQITEQVQTAVSLAVTDENLRDIKKVRTNLRKMLSLFEEQRQAIKQAVLEPYNSFEAVYKECVSEPLKLGDTELKNKIDIVEDELKAERREAVREYYSEYATQNNVSDFADFEKSGINITLSASTRSLFEAAKNHIDSIVNDIAVIAVQEHHTEILAEYKSGKALAEAITAVSERHRLMREFEDNQADKAVEVVAEQADEPLSAPVVEEEVICTQFKVWGTKTQLKELKKCLEERGLRYE